MSTEMGLRFGERGKIVEDFGEVQCPLGAGFADFVAVRERVVSIECKSEEGKLSPDQQAWNDVLGDSAVLNVHEHTASWRNWITRWEQLP